MGAMKTRYNSASINLDMRTDTNEHDIGGGETIKKLEASDTQYELLKTNTEGWAAITYTISSS
jgi:hypothetical protein